MYLLDKSLEHYGDMEIMNINDLCRCVFTRHGSVCTYVDCMGTTFAVGPDGSIYPCYRFVGMPEYVMGNVRDRPTPEDLAQSGPGKSDGPVQGIRGQGMWGMLPYQGTAGEGVRTMQLHRQKV